MSAVADTACPADPRTKDQRRADAIGAMSHGNDRLACLCDTDDCPAGENPHSTGVVVYVIASADTVREPEAPAQPPPPGGPASQGPDDAPEGAEDVVPGSADRPSDAAPQAESREDIHTDPANERTAL
ncbi:DUF222 domain-containing protein, partial [Mycobacterium sp. Root135]|uniref:DUF222 domain-containing protein n=1 Tax=Mycobacterium sp. Root135 TaxID=1736457 RepID=UPI003512CC08